jgi:predicted transcriptional regulator
MVLDDGDAAFDLPSPGTLAEAREEVMTQAEMAEILDIDPGQLSRFERGKGGMAYDKIRRYGQVLNLRQASADPYRHLRDRIEDRGPLVELAPSEGIGRALEAMTRQQVGQLPVRGEGGNPRGVLTEVALCETLAKVQPEQALSRPIDELRLEPLDRLRPGDSVTRAAALLASHWLVRLVDEEGDTVGYATRGDLFPLVLGHGVE